VSNFANENKIYEHNIINMNKIGFKNFRKFQDFPTIDLGEITILVGGNNAGKSTLVKAILLMRDFLKSRIESVDRAGNVFKSVKPQFKFDAEHVNIGEFYRAFCRQSPSKEDTMVFTMKIDKFCFVVNIHGERKPGVIPEVSMIAVSDEKDNIHFTFDFVKNQMTARFVYDKEALNSYEEEGYPIELRIKELHNALSMSKNLNEISNIKLQLEQLEKQVNSLKPDYNITEEDSVTVSMSYFIGDNIGEYVITELIKGFVNYAYVGTLGDKRSKAFKEQEANKNFIRGKETQINAIAKEIEEVFNRQTIEYVYAHSVAQTPIYANCIGSSDYTNRTIHEFYNARINTGEEEFDFIETWLKEFKIGNSLRVVSHSGDSYQVFISDDENPDGMDLADKGMGSIQLTILLLRLTTLIRKYKGQNLTVLLEEPEQNLHPALQSKLADLIFEVSQKFGVRFIIETHSEYLVRHSQVIAAKQLYEEDASLDDINNTIKVYYISQERGVIDMLFLDNAKFKDFFDEGFFDQAAREALTISRLERVNRK